VVGYDKYIGGSYFYVQYVSEHFGFLKMFKFSVPIKYNLNVSAQSWLCSYLLFKTFLSCTEIALLLTRDSEQLALHVSFVSRSERT
jgi:hypothetical protein